MLKEIKKKISTSVKKYPYLLILWPKAQMKKRLASSVDLWSLISF